MADEFAQRRRLAIAGAITVLLMVVYVLYGTNDDSSTAGDGGAIVATVPTSAPPAGERDTGPRSTDPMGTLPVGYLRDGSTTAADDAPPVIVVPQSVEGLAASATFDRSIDNTRSCYAPGTPFNERVTIKNLANGRLVACVNEIPPDVYADRVDPTEIIVHPDTFASIADVTEAPIAVEVTW